MNCKNQNCTTASSSECTIHNCNDNDNIIWVYLFLSNKSGLTSESDQAVGEGSPTTNCQAGEAESKQIFTILNVHFVNFSVFRFQPIRPKLARHKLSMHTNKIDKQKFCMAQTGQSKKILKVVVSQVAQ